MRKVLITGVNGFVGSHVAQEFAENGWEVTGIGGKSGGKPSQFISNYIEVDLLDNQAVEKIDFTGIDCVVHLAGLAAVGPSFENPLLYVVTNIGIETNLFQAAQKQGAKPRFLIISSGALYDPKAPLPLTEKSLITPSSPYAVSKLGQEQMASYFGLRDFECIIARPFNHIGPGQNPGFIIPDLTQQIVAFKNGSAEEVMVGNLDAERDYTDVRDIARAYRLLAEKGTPGEIYNICSGAPTSGNEMLHKLLHLANVNPKITQDPLKMRPSDTLVIYGNHEKITHDTGWYPEIKLDKTLADVIKDWRSRPA